LKILEQFDWVAWQKSMSELSPFARSHVLRTLLNAWTTSHRIPVGKPLKFCMFCGRNGLDKLAHMVDCHVLWEHIRQTTGCTEMLPLTSRPGLSGNKGTLAIVSFASYYYHVTKSWEHECSRLEFHIKSFNALAKLKIFCQQTRCNIPHLFGTHIAILNNDQYDGRAVDDIADSSFDASAVGSCFAPAAASDDSTTLPVVTESWEDLFLEAMGCSIDSLL
jgi:hypothetical protein